MTITYIMITGCQDTYITGNCVINVNSPPSTPTNLVISDITSSYAFISFDPALPSDNVIGYTVYVNSSPFMTFIGPAISIPISGLSTGTNYSVTIAAFNQVGISAMSSPVDFITN